MRKLIFHDLAKQDLKLIRTITVKKWGVNQASKYLMDMSKTIQLIKQNPLLGVKKQDVHNRAYGFVYKSHMIYYQYDNDCVVIAGVLHQSRLPKKHLTGRIL
jgi:toxin ParE1/3/4